MNFHDKVIVITGGSQGIGREIALSYGKAGGIVNILDINLHLAKETCKEVKAFGRQCDVYGVNIADRNEVFSVIDEVIAKFSRIDILVNSAGVINTKPIMQVTEKEWDLLMNVNLKGTFNICQAVLKPMMKQHYGKILTIASIAGKTGGGFFGNTIYGASKAGVIGLTKGLAREGGPYGINVNCLCPGGTQTKMIEELPEEMKKSIIENIPLRKFATTKDIANVALFLTSDLASHVSGEITDVDGGALRD